MVQLACAAHLEIDCADIVLVHPRCNMIRKGMRRRLAFLNELRHDLVKDLVGAAFRQHNHQGDGDHEGDGTQIHSHWFRRVITTL